VSAANSHRLPLISAAVLLLALLSACATHPNPAPSGSFDRSYYCKRMHETAVEIDADALTSGDQLALEQARDVYAQLARLAPDRLEEDWASLITDLDSLIGQADGSLPFSAEQYAAFRAAYTAIYADYESFCGPSATSQ
jgi:hypothetical protein